LTEWLWVVIYQCFCFAVFFFEKKWEFFGKCCFICVWVCVNFTNFAIFLDFFFQFFDNTIATQVDHHFGYIKKLRRGGRGGGNKNKKK
jgi:hypothetical protein